MKIGIITFHWGTNYGAILQCYALQTYLSKFGYDVLVINYKPKRFDFSLFSIITSRKILSFRYSLRNFFKEKELENFRKTYLRLTRRYLSLNELKRDPPNCDIYISGSDQILNPSFTLYGEEGKKPASTYFLDFGDSTTKRVGYAVSFGCTVYPDKAKFVAQSYIDNFDFISVREKTGIDILRGMGCYDSEVVADPTLLLNQSDYNGLISKTPHIISDYYVYMLRNRKAVTKRLINMFPNCVVADSNGEYSVHSWISNIKYSEFVITNSYHGVVFCLHFHTPFVVVVKSLDLNNGNDRFFTLLEPMNLMCRIIAESNVHDIERVKLSPINWEIVDSEIKKIQKTGVDFLNKIFNI